MDLKIIIFRVLLSVIIGGLIGTERARHGRAAGMRTHILVTLGAALTSMTGIYVNEIFNTGDVLRISAQVISGIGFLGAGMIILKNGNIVTGLTTAAGMWTTASIGIAVGYGFYIGAVSVAALYLISIVFFTKLERSKRNSEVVYMEIDDLKQINHILNDLHKTITVRYDVSVVPAKSMKAGNVGIYITFRKKIDFDMNVFLNREGIVYIIEE